MVLHDTDHSYHPWDPHRKQMQCSRLQFYTDSSTPQDQLRSIVLSNHGYLVRIDKARRMFAVENSQLIRIHKVLRLMKHENVACGGKINYMLTS